MTRFVVTSIAAAILLLSVPVGALAQTPVEEPAVAPPSAAHLAAAAELIALLRIEEAAMVAVMVAIDQQIQASPPLADFRDVMEGWARDVFTSDEARAAFARLYAEEMSEADIRALVDFYQTPLGQRLAARQATLASRGAELGQRLAERRQSDLMRRVEQREQELRKP